PRRNGTLADSYVQHQQLELDLYVEQGLTKMKRGQLTAAADAFKKVLAMDPNHGPTNNYIAEVYLQQGLFKLASEHAARAANDGFPDLFFINGAPGAPNALYHNNKDGTFTDVTERAGVAANGGGKEGPAAKAYRTGVAVGDYDNDGYLDLYVTAFGPNILYHNNGDGTFRDVTATAGVAGGPAEWSTSTGFFDYDRDGRLDLYVVNYLDYRLDENPYCGLRKEGYRMYCKP